MGILSGEAYPFSMMNSRYRIVAEVGRGQFGQVFCGSDRTTGELVALKNLDHRRFKTRNFLRELAVLIRLNHPNIVSFHALEYNATGRYIVMDYCQGGTLRHLMESKQELDLIQKLRIVQDILLGLEHAHTRQVIHCDLKPENILLNATSQGWMAQIADFGIAHFSEQPEPSDSTGDTGSPAYMAPERFYGKYSPASDLYAIGVILFELVAGKRPFSGMPFEVMNAHFSHPLRIPKSLPMMLKSVIRKALQKLPQNRYASATEMRLDIETVVSTLEHADLNAKSCNNEIDILEGEPDKASATQNFTLKKPRQIGLQPRHLQVRLEQSETIARLWIRPQGCFIAQHSSDGLTVLSLQTDGISKRIGDFLQTNAERIDIDPLGRWLAIAHSSVDSPSEGSGDEPMTSLLQILKLSDFQSNFQSNFQIVNQQSIEGRINRFWFSNSHHILVSLEAIETIEHPQTLQLWNRRGQFYWSYPLAGQLKEAVLSATQNNRLFAIAQEDSTTGLLIDLRPFTVTRIPLGIHADWISATHWGYILVHRTGQMVCLNRRGRMMAQTQLPLQAGETVTAIATHGPAELWLATQHGPQSILYTLDLASHLPRSLLKI
jgi:serine/threonine protein kinase